MKFVSFLKLVNRKVNKYDKFASNPFKANYIPIPITIVWVEDTNKNFNNDS